MVHVPLQVGHSVNYLSKNSDQILRWTGNLASALLCKRTFEVNLTHSEFVTLKVIALLSLHTVGLYLSVLSTAFLLPLAIFSGSHIGKTKNKAKQRTGELKGVMFCTYAFFSSGLWLIA